MIGAMPAVAVRHERRKNKTKDKPVRPSRLQIQQMKAAVNEGLSPAGGPGSENPSRVGTPIHGHPAHPTNGDIGVATSAESTQVRYGDECFYGKVSLLHFIIFFLLGGLTVIIVGAVQFKREAGLSYLRYHFLVAGALLIAVGCLLLVVKCVCYRVPLPDEDDEEAEDLEKDDDEKKKLSANTGSPHQVASGSPNMTVIGETNSRQSPSKDHDISSSRRASRGDVVHHHVVVKAGDETRSLLTANRNGDTGNESVVLATPHAGSDVMDHV